MVYKIQITTTKYKFESHSYTNLMIRVRKVSKWYLVHTLGEDDGRHVNNVRRNLIQHLA